MKSTFLILLFILSLSASAQKLYVENNKVYGKAKIFQKGKKAINAKNLVLKDSVFQFADELDKSKKMEISSRNVNAIAVGYGNKALGYTASGAAIGLLFSYGSFNYLKKMGEKEIDQASFITGYTIGGAVLGAILGFCTPKWKTMYLKDNYKTYSINLSPDVKRNYCGIGLKLNF